MLKRKPSGKPRLSRPKTIVICSSASFYKQVLEVRDALKKMGFRVVAPLTAGKMERSGDFSVGTYKTWFGNPDDYDRKRFLMTHHFKKPIYILNPIDESVSYKEEILGMLPTVINGDLSLI